MKNQTYFYELDFFKVFFSDSCVEKALKNLHNITQHELNEFHSNIVQNITSGMPQLLKSSPYYDSSRVQQIRDLAKTFASSFDTLVVVGIGGALLNSMCMNDFCGNKKILFVHQLCKNHLENICSNVNLKSTGFVFISNSGDTVEVIELANYFFESLRKNNIESLSSRMLFIYNSKRQSLLQNLHKKIGGEFLEYDADMGGRFSTFSTHNIFLASVSGIDVNDLFSGANKILNSFIEKSQEFTKVLLSGTMMLASGLYHFQSNIIASNFDSRLDNMMKWYCGVISETLGKTPRSLLPLQLTFPIDQHGMLEAILTNNNNQFLNLFSIQEDQNNNISALVKVLENEICDQFETQKIPVRKFILNNTKASTLGAFMMYMILETIATAVILEINPFNQPHVDNIKHHLAEKYKKGI